MEAAVNKHKPYFCIVQYWLPVLAYCGLIFLLSSPAGPANTSTGLLNNKILHVAEYSILGFLMARALLGLNSRHSRQSVLVLAVMLSALYGLSDEIHQAFTPGRSANLGDVMADGLGALIGVCSYWWVLTRSWSGSEKGR